MHSEDNAVEEEAPDRRTSERPSKSSSSSGRASRKQTSKVRHASTETPMQVNLAEVWSRAMEDGAMTVNSSKVKKVFVVSQYAYPAQASEKSSSHSVWGTRMDNGDEGILIGTGAAINCVGDQFCQRFNDLMEAKGAPPAERVKFETLPSAHYISGQIGRAHV